MDFSMSSHAIPPLVCDPLRILLLQQLPMSSVLPWLPRVEQVFPLPYPKGRDVEEQPSCILLECAYFCCMWR
jgi:hypothetical protein